MIFRRKFLRLLRIGSVLADRLPRLVVRIELILKQDSSILVYRARNGHIGAVRGVVYLLHFVLSQIWVLFK